MLLAQDPRDPTQGRVHRLQYGQFLYEFLLLKATPGGYLPTADTHTTENSYFTSNISPFLTHIPL